MKTTHALRSGFVLILFCALGLSTAQAQATTDTPADTIRADRSLSIEVTEDGRVIIDGEVVRRGEGPLVLDFDEDDRIVVVRPGPGAARRFVARDPVAFRFEGDFPEGMRHLEGLGERLEHEIAPRLDGLLDEMGMFRRYYEGRDWQVDEEIVRMEQEAHRLARRVRDAEGAERRRLEEALHEHLDALFDRKLALRSERIDRLEEELARQRDQLQQRRAQRDEIVTRRLRELLGEEDVLDW